jgi:hypothetical protein
MAQFPGNPPNDNDEVSPAAQQGDGGPNERIQLLTWALLDELISDEEMSALDGLLLSDAAARSEYLRCVELHADLHSHFAEKPSTSAQPSETKIPVLGFLHDESPPLGLQTPPVEDVSP